MKDFNESLFLPASTFMVRVPQLPIDDFYDLLKNANLYEKLFTFYENNPIIQESILIASPSLYEGLANRHQSSNKRIKQLASSLLKYISRMSTRPTPFGLFSFVSMGKWGSGTELFFNFKNVKKRARTDIAWLASVLAKICEENILLPSVLIRTNPLAYTVGGRTYLKYIRKKNNKNSKQKISVRNSPLIKRIIELSKTPIAMLSLEEKILFDYPKIERNKLQILIRQLLTKQILRLSIMPSLLSETPFEDFINNVENSFGKIATIAYLHRLLKEIENYSEISLGKGVIQLKELFTKMNKVSNSGFTPLQIDSAYPSNLLTLNKKISNELSEVSEILWKLSFWKKDLNPLKSYHSEFLNKYGSSRIVNLKEVLNEDLGLGIPETYKGKNLKHYNISEEEEKFIQWLRKEYEECLYKRKQEIVLNEKFLKNLTTNIDKTEALLSFDITCEIIANSQQDIDAGNYLIFVPFITWEGGSTSSRFLDLLGDSAKSYMKDLIHNEELLEKNTLFSDISFMPFDIRTGNVCIHKNFRKYVIDLDNPLSKFGKQISFDDIYVGATSKRLFLTLKNTKKELVVRAHHLFNPDLAPEIVKFLREVSSERYSNISPFFWGDLEQSFFLPRIIYKKTILCAAQWIITLDILQMKKNIKPQQLEIPFNNWAKKWKIPRYVFMTVGDKRVLLDRKQSEHLHEILKEIQKGNEVKLIEKLGQNKGCWVKSERGLHVSEFTISFIKNKKYSSPEDFSQIPVHKDILLKDRIKLPGSEWLFAKFYMNQDSENYFIAELLPKFINAILHQKIINQFFFIRYKCKNGDHLRIRFKGKKGILASKLIPLLHDWILELYEDQLIKDYHLSSYEKEIERYGGAELMDYAENFFFFDSYCTIVLLQLIKNKAINFPNYVVAALSIIDLLKNCGFNVDESIKFLSFSNKDKNELIGFREWRKPLTDLSKVMMQDNLFENKNDKIQLLKKTFTIRKEALLKYSKKIKQKGKNISIIETLIHIHCNRFLGTNHSLEKKARVYALQSLISLRHLSIVGSH
ncbi:MAG: hypothetical protein AMS24_02790 [Chlamydiae bacterium SM23_39]|nr:MAG: hypothetical protein AMS24_02790 [Chlamydiae bacterium SM23_39]